MNAPLPADVVEQVIEDAYLILDDVFQPRPGCCDDCDELLAEQTPPEGNVYAER